MKKLIVVLLCLLSLLMTGCHKKDIDDVRNGKLERPLLTILPFNGSTPPDRFEESMTVGQAMDNYKYFKNTKWKVLTDGKSIKRVEAIGNFVQSDKNEKFKNVFIKFQFQKNRHNRIEILWCAFGADKKDGSKIEPLENTTQIQCGNYLGLIYINYAIPYNDILNDIVQGKYLQSSFIPEPAPEPLPPPEPEPQPEAPLPAPAPEPQPEAPLPAPAPRPI
jgi:hypothetical protein